MQKEELRIGNFVILDNPMHRPCESGKTHKVVGISEKSAHIMRIHDNLMEDYYGQFYEFIKPIPLTEEWLLNFGFKKHSEFNFFEKEIKPNKNFIVDYSMQSKDYFLCDTDIDTSIKCVHQLQNLYFALTGEELEIKADALQ